MSLESMGATPAGGQDLGGIPPPTRTRILVVDDEALQRQVLCDLLVAEGYEVATAASGVEALAQVLEAPPDCVLLDVLMPGMDGYEICRRLKSDLRTVFIPVVIVTVLRRLEDKVKGIEAGADDFLLKPVNPLELLARVRASLRLKLLTDELDHAEGILAMLSAAVEARDPFLVGHCERLATSALELGRAVGIDSEGLAALRRGGLLHDLGKIAVPDAILLKGSPLTPAEQAVMMEHVLVGERICQPLRSLRPVLPIIRSHHERWDGSGYPDGLRGEAIPLLARILQIADIYDALRTPRPYRVGLPPTEAATVLREETARGWRDPRLVEVFVALPAVGLQ